MPDYSKGLIYKLKCKDTNITEVYYGSTCDFPDRYNEHRRQCIIPTSKEYNSKKYKFIREHGGWEGWTMMKVKNFPCNSKDELETEEDKYIVIGLSAEGGCLNTNRARRTKEQYYNDNNVRLKLKQIKYRKDNIDAIRKKEKIKYTCECGDTLTKSKKARHNRTKKHQAYLLLKDIETTYQK